MLVLQEAQADVSKLIAGPEVFICDECVVVCNDIIAEDERWTNRTKESQRTPTPTPKSAPTKDRVACNLCGNLVLPTEALPIAGRGVLCGECADAVEDALGEGRPPEGK